MTGRAPVRDGALRSPVNTAQGQPERNAALDYLRAVALLAMASVHFWRPILDSAAGEGIVLTIGEWAPFPFFIAFGMTQARQAHRGTSARRAYLVLFGLVGVLHSCFLWLALQWEFLLCLWFWSLLLMVAASWQPRPVYVAVLCGALLVLNAVVPFIPNPFVPATSGTAGQWYRYAFTGAFPPLPWGALVLLGFAAGLAFPGWLRRPAVLAVLAAAVVVGVYRIMAKGPEMPIGVRFGIQKWMATSTYLCTGCAATLVVYALCERCARLPWMQRRVYPQVRFVSESLLEGTVLHYLVGRSLLAASYGSGLLAPSAHTGSVPTLICLSIANAALLLVALRLLMRLWAAVVHGGARLLARSRWWAVAAVAAALLGVVEAAYVSGRCTDFAARWCLFAVLLCTALYLRFERGRGLRPIGR